MRTPLEILETITDKLEERISGLSDFPEDLDFRELLDEWKDMKRDMEYTRDMLDTIVEIEGDDGDEEENLLP